jgi:hypothetical protein
MALARGDDWIWRHVASFFSVQPSPRGDVHVWPPAQHVKALALCCRLMHGLLRHTLVMTLQQRYLNTSEDCNTLLDDVNAQSDELDTMTRQVRDLQTDNARFRTELQRDEMRWIRMESESPWGGSAL